MSKRTMIVNVDKDSWLNMRSAFPKLSDSKRSKLLISNFDVPAFKAKLNPELTDTTMDKRMKRILKGII